MARCESLHMVQNSILALEYVSYVISSPVMEVMFHLIFYLPLW
jgi:hypothetical protein